jgi:DNA-binding NarL/FixJ family response regulator
MKRVLVVDDHALIRDGIKSLLETENFEVVGEAETGAGAVDLALKLHPDLILMDIHMPVMDGLDALKQIKTLLPDIHVVMLTVSEEDDDLVRAINLGANGFLLKQINSADFVELLEDMDNGNAVMTRKTMARVMRIFPKNVVIEKEDILTEREFEILKLISEGKSNRDIAVAIDLSENTVKTHLKSIMQKLNASNRTEAVMVAARQHLI